MAFKKIKAKLAARKKLRTYKKKVRKSKLYKKSPAGDKQKKVDVLAKKRTLGIGNKKRVQKKINRVIKGKSTKKGTTLVRRKRVLTPLYKTKK